MVVRGPFTGRAADCAPILRSLPEWFGIEEATAQYVQDIDALPTLLAFVGDEVVGFLTLKYHSAYAAEIHVMGVRPELHRRGIGRALLAQAQRVLREGGIEYLQVKTLSASREDERYARTRHFYLAMGFRPLEEFPELWGEDNPCLQLVKWLGTPS
jgi:GNAT superfamily N-acetyltransferase